MSASPAMQVALFAAEAFALSTLVMLAAHLAGSQGRAALRHLVHLGGFVVLLAWPVAKLVLPPLWHWRLPAAPPLAALPPLALAPTGDTASPAAAMAQHAPAVSLVPDAAVLALLLVFVWTAGLGVIGLRALAAQIGLMRLRRASRPFADVRPARDPAVAAIRIGDAGPLAFGLLRPVILLPGDAGHWPQARLDAVLAHERAHLARRDGISQALAKLACALYWPNPLVWRGYDALKRAAEMAADDAVLAAGMKPSDYAGTLVAIAARARALPATQPMAAPAMLRARVAAILSQQVSREGASSMDIARISVAALMTTAAFALVCPALAQADAPAPAAPVAQALPPPQPAPVLSADEPAPPPAPPATVDEPPPAIPAAPPAPPAPEAKDQPRMQVREFVTTDHGKSVRRVIVTTGDAGKLAEEAMAKAGPQIEKALEQLRNAQPEVEKAMATLKGRQHEIDLAMLKMRDALAKMKLSMRVREQVDQNGAHIAIDIAKNGNGEVTVEHGKAGDMTVERIDGDADKAEDAPH